MFNRHGIERVIEPKHVLPTSAWRIDNNRDIFPNELRISLEKIHIESTSFRQICIESNNNMDKVKDRVMDIIIKRGKIHNPVTDTGGIAYGTVEAIGENYANSKELKVGDKVICNASLAAIPIYISRINKIDMVYTQFEAEGYAILLDEFPIVKAPEDVPVNLLLYAFDESGTLYTVNEWAREKRRCLVVGNSLLTNLLYGYAARQAAGPDAEIVCLFDVSTEQMLKGKSIEELMKKTFSSIHYVSILKPIECLEQLDIGLFDLSINCADIPGVETVNILSTKKGGSIIFANLINNYNIALYITEAIAREIYIKCADGYLEAYDDYDIALVKEMAPYIEKAQYTEFPVEDNIAYPIGKAGRGLEQEGYRKSLVEDFICESRAMAVVLDEILSVAKYDCNVLISGDTGVGKERIAAIIQKNSTRRMQPFIKINCAAISENLMESEFFGYEKGAFTGANQTGKMGYFEMADNGIIFMDEVGELPLDMQAKLLRVIQDGEFFRVGGTKPVKTNVRILSATNRNLEELVEQKLFRRDLYYRLNVFPIRVPSLREREAEIPALVHHFLTKYNEKFGIERNINEDALEYLKNHNWPGNIRELENVVQRLLITAKGQYITLFDVMKEIHGDLYERLPSYNAEEIAARGEPLNLSAMLEAFERNVLKYAYEKYGSSRKAAKAIGISQTQFVRKKNKYMLKSGQSQKE